VPNCNDTPGAVFGVSASAAFDRQRNAVFVEGGDGQVYALNPVTGATLPGWPVRLTTIPNTEVVFGAPTLVRNHLYYVIAAHCDTIPYHGRVVDIDLNARAIAHTFYVTGSASGPYGGGIWGWGGASVDPANGDVYVATGNSFANPENTPYADSLVRLSPTLQLKASHTPVVQIRDDDFGATPTLFQAPGCPPQLVVEQKNGSLYLYDRDAIASGPRQRVAIIDPPGVVPGPHEPGLVGVNLYYPHTGLVYVISPSDKADGSYKQGLIAFRVNANCRLERAWQSSVPTSIAATATIANNVAYVVGGSGGKVYAVDARSGARLWDSGTSTTASLFAAPVIVGNRLYAGGYDNRLHAWGL